ncbi:MAG: MFS transporter, partial [Phycisphaerae bacterium]
MAIAQEYPTRTGGTDRHSRRNQPHPRASKAANNHVRRGPDKGHSISTLSSTAESVPAGAPAAAVASQPVANNAARVRARLGAIAFSHGVVDFFSALVIPLLSVLEEQASMTPAQGAALIAAGSLSSGIIQPGVALVGDKRDTRSLGTIGLMVAALAIGLIGFADSFWKLLILQVLGAAGIGAFHPPAAAVMGHLSGRKRSMGVSIFFAAGILGGAGGAFTAPIWAEVLGIK